MYLLVALVVSLSFGGFQEVVGARRFEHIPPRSLCLGISGKGPQKKAPSLPSSISKRLPTGLEALYRVPKVSLWGYSGYQT